MEKREIKFRCWDVESKKMYSTAFPTWNGSIETRDGDYTHPTLFLSQNGPAEEGHLMQYTGLKDKNGVEIYEGDIMVSKTEGVGNRIVKWSDGNGAYFVVSNSATKKVDWDNCLTDEFIQHFDYKILGNIYQNPELLS